MSDEKLAALAADAEAKGIPPQLLAILIQAAIAVLTWFKERD